MAYNSPNKMVKKHGKGSLMMKDSAAYLDPTGEKEETKEVSLSNVDLPAQKKGKFLGKYQDVGYITPGSQFQDPSGKRQGKEFTFGENVSQSQKENVLKAAIKERGRGGAKIVGNVLRVYSS